LFTAGWNDVNDWIDNLYVFLPNFKHILSYHDKKKIVSNRNLTEQRQCTNVISSKYTHTKQPAFMTILNRSFKTHTHTHTHTLKTKKYKIKK